jgi:hypothetical protein
MWINFFKMNLFKAALTPKLRSVVAQQDPDTMTIKRMYQVATTAQREGKGKAPASVNEINEEENSGEQEDDNNDVAAFNKRGARPKMGKNNFQNGRGGYNSGRGSYQTGAATYRRGGFGGGNNSNCKGKYCYFYKIQGHRQEECRKRLQENKPCRDAQGRTYWPKIYFMDENSDAKSINAIEQVQNEFDEFQNNHRDAELDIAGIDFDQKYKPRTAALSPHNLGFQ